jgi:hypothetical protein
MLENWIGWVLMGRSIRSPEVCGNYWIQRKITVRHGCRGRRNKELLGRFEIMKRDRREPMMALRPHVNLSLVELQLACTINFRPSELFLKRRAKLIFFGSLELQVYSFAEDK